MVGVEETKIAPVFCILISFYQATLEEPLREHLTDYQHFQLQGCQEDDVQNI